MSNKQNIEDFLGGNPSFNPFVQIDDFEAFLKNNKAKQSSMPLQLLGLLGLLILVFFFVAKNVDFAGSLKAGQSSIAGLNDLTKPPLPPLSPSKLAPNCDALAKPSYLARASVNKYQRLAALEEDFGKLRFQEPNPKLAQSLESIRAKLLVLDKNPVYSQESFLWEEAYPLNFLENLRANLCSVGEASAYGKLYANASALRSDTLYSSLLSDLENKQAALPNVLLASSDVKTTRDCQCKCLACKDLRDCACTCSCK